MLPSSQSQDLSSSQQHREENKTVDISNNETDCSSKDQMQLQKPTEDNKPNDNTHIDIEYNDTGTVEEDPESEKQSSEIFKNKLDRAFLSIALVFENTTAFFVPDNIQRRVNVFRSKIIGLTIAALLLGSLIGLYWWHSGCENYKVLTRNKEDMDNCLIDPISYFTTLRLDTDSRWEVDSAFSKPTAFWQVKFLGFASKNVSNFQGTLNTLREKVNKFLEKAVNLQTFDLLQYFLHTRFVAKGDLGFAQLIPSFSLTSYVQNFQISQVQFFRSEQLQKCAEIDQKKCVFSADFETLINCGNDTLGPLLRYDINRLGISNNYYKISNFGTEFQMELNLLKQLQHNGVAQIFDSNTCEQSQEIIGNQTLFSKLKNPITVREFPFFDECITCKDMDISFDFALINALDFCNKNIEVCSNFYNFKNDEANFSSDSVYIQIKQIAQSRYRTSSASFYDKQIGKFAYTKYELGNEYSIVPEIIPSCGVCSSSQNNISEEKDCTKEFDIVFHYYLKRKLNSDGVSMGRRLLQDNQTVTDMSLVGKGINLVVLLDVSGSMDSTMDTTDSQYQSGETRISVAKTAIIDMLKNLKQYDRLSIVTFESQAQVVLNLTLISDITNNGSVNLTQFLETTFKNITASGGTDLAIGFQAATKQFQNCKECNISENGNQIIDIDKSKKGNQIVDVNKFDKRNQIVVVTDLDQQDYGNILNQSQLVKQGSFATILAIGQKFNETLIRSIRELGANHLTISNATQLQTKLNEVIDNRPSPPQPSPLVQSTSPPSLQPHPDLDVGAMLKNKVLIHLGYIDTKSYYYSLEKLDWMESYRRCESLGGNLLQLDSSATEFTINVFLQTNAFYQFTKNTTNGKNFWIGLENINGHEHCTTTLNSNYKNWCQQNYSSNLEKNQMSCFATNFQFENGVPQSCWQSLLCEQKNVFVCEFIVDVKQQVGSIPNIPALRSHPNPQPLLKNIPGGVPPLSTQQVLTNIIMEDINNDQNIVIEELNQKIEPQILVDMQDFQPQPSHTKIVPINESGYEFQTGINIQNSNQYYQFSVLVQLSSSDPQLAYNQYQTFMPKIQCDGSSIKFSQSNSTTQVPFTLSSNIYQCEVRSCPTFLEKLAMAYANVEFLYVIFAFLMVLIVFFCCSCMQSEDSESAAKDSESLVETLNTVIGGVANL